MSLFTKKRLQMAGCILMSAMMFTACSSGNAPSSSTTANGESGGDEAKPTLKALVHNFPQGGEDLYPAVFIEDATGYTIEFEALPMQNQADVLNMKMSTGEEYDYVTVIGSTQNRAIINRLAEQGALQPLDDLIEQYGPNILANMDEKALTANVVDGKIYSIAVPAPAPNGVGHIWNSFFVRQDWMDELGLEAPETTEDFANILREFKEKDPGENGELNIPFTISSTVFQEVNASPLRSPFGITARWNEVDGELVPDIMMDGYKDYLTYMKGLYDEQLLDIEFPTNKNETRDEKFLSGRAGIMLTETYNMDYISNSISQNIPEADISTFLPAKNPNGNRTQLVNAGYEQTTFIPTASENPEEVIKLINAKLEEDTFKQSVLGEEGVHYTFEDGAYAPIQPKFMEDMGKGNLFLTGATDSYGEYWMCRNKKDPLAYETYLNVSMNPELTPVENVLAFAPALPIYSENNASLDSMIQDFEISVIVGTESIDNLDSFIEEWKLAGGEETMKEVNEWYASR